MATIRIQNIYFRGKGRNPGKNFVGFLEDLKTPKGHFEIN